jgi:hypothetical protein
MKTFYTERDIEDMHAAGVRQIEVNDDVVLTDLAREKAEKLGVVLIPTNQTVANLQPSPASAVSSLSPTKIGLSRAEIAAKVKARVIARLGTDEYNDLLEAVIPQVLARLQLQVGPEQGGAASAAAPDEY